MVKPLLTVTIVWLVLGISFPLYAQKFPETLGTLWKNVEENYSGIKVKHSSADAAALNERAVKSNMLPQIKAQAQSTYGTYNGGGGAFFPQAGFFNVSGDASLYGASLSANSFVSAVVDWEVFSFGKLRKENQAARAATNKKNSEKDAYLLSLKKLLSERYITLLYNKTKLSWNEKTLERLNEIRSITSGLSKAGLKPAADSLLASSAYTQSLAANYKLEGNSSAALIKLQELSAKEAFELNSSLTQFSTPVAYLEHRNGLIENSHPILTTLKHQADVFNSKSAVEKSASLPSVHFLGGLSYKGSSINDDGYVSGKWQDGFSNNVNNFLAGVRITWNISNLLTNSYKSQGLTKEAESIENLHAQYEQTMQADLTAVQVRISQQFKQIEKTTTAVKQAGDGYKMYLSRYKSGLIGLNELLQIQQLFEVAENSHLEASREYWMLVAYEAELTSNFNFLFTNL
ncbi:TolC family protein [Flavobacterium sp. Arc3]|uniref:TolC family protein n=1 Tax=Flavobacterium sp. Arc3 TaxID=3046686 RepID=UPI00352DA6AC